jgi:peptidoglycan/xylan/chitin deacetylase (PgdA/CDA1 family)
MSSESLRSVLTMLSRGGYSFVSLSELLDRAESRGKSLHKAICFTVDDGYADFYEVAAPVFREFDCPATVFLTTGFLDGKIWLWWDQLQFLFEETEASSLRVEIGGRDHHFAWTDSDSRLAAVQDVSELLKTVPDSARLEGMARIGESLGVCPPDSPPPSFAPLTWDQVRELGGQGFRFGPHSVTHPILSQMDDAASSYEIKESWDRLRAETDAVEPVFAYPNGVSGDFSAREQRSIQEVGLRAALTARKGFVRYQDLLEEERRFALPRFGLPTDLAAAALIVTGLQRLRLSLGRANSRS